jgi:hypothetical protein
VIVIGSETARELFGSSDPVGRTVRIGRHPYRVLGVLEEKGPSPFGQSQDEVVLMPMTTIRSHILVTQRGSTHAILMSATSEETTERAKRQAEAILRDRHHIGERRGRLPRAEPGRVSSQMQDAIFGALTMLLIGIATISLVVGGIGVMNIMLVSVTERTREIGIRMAIGAREMDMADLAGADLGAGFCGADLAGADLDDLAAGFAGTDLGAGFCGAAFDALFSGFAGDLSALPGAGVALFLGFSGLLSAFTLGGGMRPTSSSEAPRDDAFTLSFFFFFLGFGSSSASSSSSSVSSAMTAWLGGVLARSVTNFPK